VLRPPGETGLLAIAPYPAELSETWNAGGETLTIRPIRPEDAAAHAAMFSRLTPEDVRFRFFSALRALSPERLARMTQVDYDREMAFVAIRANGDTVGVSRLVRDADGTGEFAIVVQPDMRGRGLARRLMQRLIAWGGQQGLTAIIGQVLADNAPMLGFMRALGFTLHQMVGEPGVMEVRLELARVKPG
jgi:acetyltransferase